MTPTITRGFERWAMAYIGVLVTAGVVAAAFWPTRGFETYSSVPAESSPADTDQVQAGRRPEAGAPGATELPAPAETGVEAPTIAPAKPEDVRESLIERLMPIVLSLNQQLLQERNRLWTIRTMLLSGGTPTWADNLFVDVALERYVVPDGNLEELSRRMDAVPPSLVVAGIAHATDWGRRKANFSMFTGQARVGRGPTTAEQRAASAEGEDALVSLARAYTHALNSDPAYELFRRKRQNMRIAAKPLDGALLAETLPATGSGDPVQAILLRNELARLDEHPAVAAAAAPEALHDGL